jgi:anaerobic selenocysteine-containing dehydrogenase
MSRDGELAHYVLPCTSPLQRPDLPFVFPLMLGCSATPYLQATRAVVPPAGRAARRGDDLHVDLAGAAGADPVRGWRSGASS